MARGAQTLHRRGQSTVAACQPSSLGPPARRCRRLSDLTQPGTGPSIAPHMQHLPVSRPSRRNALPRPQHLSESNLDARRRASADNPDPELQRPTGRGRCKSRDRHAGRDARPLSHMCFFKGWPSRMPRRARAHDARRCGPQQAPPRRSVGSDCGTFVRLRVSRPWLERPGMQARIVPSGSAAASVTSQATRIQLRARRRAKGGRPASGPAGSRSSCGVIPARQLLPCDARDSPLWASTPRQSGAADMLLLMDEGCQGLEEEAVRLPAIR